MDKFVTQLKGGTPTEGTPTTIKRCSTNSSVVRPWEPTFVELEGKTKATQKDKADSDCRCKADRYCECGIPQHMLLPRGTAAGMEFDLFVMVTNWETESTDDLDRGTSYCGVKDEKYPDKRAMGFPFDRKIRHKSDDKRYPFYEHVTNFAKRFSNMVCIPITIKRVDGQFEVTDRM